MMVKPHHLVSPSRPTPAHRPLSDSSPGHPPCRQRPAGPAPRQSASPVHSRRARPSLPLTAPDIRATQRVARQQAPAPPAYSAPSSSASADQPRPSPQTAQSSPTPLYTPLPDSAPAPSTFPRTAPAESSQSAPSPPHPSPACLSPSSIAHVPSSPAARPATPQCCAESVPHQKATPHPHLPAPRPQQFHPRSPSRQAHRDAQQGMKPVAHPAEPG